MLLMRTNLGFCEYLNAGWEAENVVHSREISASYFAQQIAAVLHGLFTFQAGGCSLQFLMHFRPRRVFPPRARRPR